MNSDPSSSKVLVSRLNTVGVKEKRTLSQLRCLVTQTSNIVKLIKFRTSGSNVNVTFLSLHKFLKNA